MAHARNAVLASRKKGYQRPPPKCRLPAQNGGRGAIFRPEKTSE